MTPPHVITTVVLRAVTPLPRRRLLPPSNEQCFLAICWKKTKANSAGHCEKGHQWRNARRLGQLNPFPRKFSYVASQGKIHVHAGWSTWQMKRRLLSIGNLEAFAQI